MDDVLFRIRDPKQLGQAVRKLVPWEAAHTYCVGPRAAGARSWMLRAFRKFAAESPTLPVDQAVVKFLWSRLEGASPLTVAGYCGSLLRALAAEGVVGARTKRVLATRRALTRFGTLLRPRQAPPVDTAVVQSTVEALLEQGCDRESAFVALVWVARARMSDVRYLLVRDLTLVCDEGVEPGLEVALKEKQQRQWSPVVYLPPGELTCRVVAWWQRCSATGPDTPLFAATEAEYQALLKRVVARLPAGSWAHSLRRGSAQVLQKWGMELDGLQSALRHASGTQTRRYMMSTAEADRRKAREQLDALQGGWV